MRIRCVPSTFELMFGKEGKDYSDLLIQALEDFLSELNYGAVSLAASAGIDGLSATGVKQIADALYELKLSHVNGMTPRCTVSLMTIYNLQDIVGKYADKTKDHRCRFLRMYLRDIGTKMQDVKWGD